MIECNKIWLYMFLVKNYASSSSSSSSSNSPSSSALASWYCWYSDTRSFILDSASVNSISSIPSPVYQWRKAFLLNIQHLLVNFFHGHPTTEHCSYCEIPPMSGITGCHHVLGVKHLLCELGNCESSVLLTAPGCQGGETRHEEM